MVMKLLVGITAALLATGVGVYVAFSGTPAGGESVEGPALTHSPCCSAPAEPSCCSEHGSCCAEECAACPVEGLAACAGGGAFSAGSQARAGKAACCEK